MYEFSKHETNIGYAVGISSNYTANGFRNSILDLSILDSYEYFIRVFIEEFKRSWSKSIEISN